MAVSRGVLAAALFAVGPMPSLASQEGGPAQASERVVFRAEAVVREVEDGPIVATGDVRATFGGRYLTADRVVYDPQTEIVTAYGDVAIYEANGTPFFADEVVLTDDLADGVAANFSALLEGNSRLAASSAVRRRDGRNELNNAVYTTCEVCAADGERRRPTWQVRASRVTQDTEAEVIRFRNAVVEVLGVPVFYTPYVQAPDPSVDRKSGLLTPRFGTSSQRGFELEVPLYVAVSDHQDVTFRPRHYTQLGTLLQAEYRLRTHDSGLVAQGGVIFPSDEETQNDPALPGPRWHVFSSAFRDLPDDWRFQADVNLTSDDQYLQFYGVEPEGELQDVLDIIRPDRLVSEVAMTRRKPRSLTDVSGIVFQSQRRSDDDAFQANALPRITHLRSYDVPRLGGEATVLGNLLYLNRRAGLDTARAVAEATYERRRTTSGGHRFRSFAQLRADVYRFEDASLGVEDCNVQSPDYEVCRFALPRDAGDDGYTTAHLLPTVGAEWSFPLARIGEGATWIVEPRVQVAASPRTDFAEDTLNEDSQFFQFDGVTLFDWSKGTGFDLFEDGLRANVGLSGTAILGDKLTVSGLVGQQFRLNETATFGVSSARRVIDPSTGEPVIQEVFTNDTGLGDEVSDVVGNLDVRYGSSLDVTNRFRFDRRDGTLDRGESTLRASVGRFSSNLSYLRVERPVLGAEGERDEFLTATGAYRLTDRWTLGAGVRGDLVADEITSQNVLLRYRDSCLSFTVNYRFDNTFRAGADQNRSILFSIDLLGF